MTMVDNALMTLEELAEYLRVKKRTVYDWVKKGKIPAIKTVVNGDLKNRPLMPGWKVNIKFVK